jgi:hypothetical protein
LRLSDWAELAEAALPRTIEAAAAAARIFFMNFLPLKRAQRTAQPRGTL